MRSVALDSRVAPECTALSTAAPLAACPSSSVNQYLYPTSSAHFDVTVQSWVRATSAHLDAPLADAVARWLATEWPWERIDRCGR